jgi:hypothetical protein
MDTKFCSFSLILILLLLQSSCKNLKKSETNIRDGPPNPIYYYQDAASWFGIYGLQQYYGLYCQNIKIVTDQTSSSKPGYKFAYFTCDQCTSVKDKYLAHPIGLIFAAADKPQRVKYLDSQSPKIQAYRCQ